MSGSGSSDIRGKTIRHLVVLVAFMVFMYLCAGIFRFAHEGLNLAFKGVFYSIPLFALKPALRLTRWTKIVTLILLSPCLSSPFSA